VSRPVLALKPPPDRGLLLTPEQVAQLIGGVSAAWVRRNVRPKMRIGHSTVRYFASDVQAWLEARRKDGAT